jgi:DNA-binding beta-propeller fold protein YncE
MKLAVALLVTAFCADAGAQTPLYHLVRTVPLGGTTKWDYLYFNPATDRVFVSHGDEVTVVSGRTGRVVGALADLPGSHGIRVDPATGLIYADSAGRSDVVAFDPKTFRPVFSAPVLPDADGINYDAFSKTMFVSGGDGDGLTPVSTVTRMSGPTIALGTSPEFHVSDDAGSEYVDLVDADALARIDSKTGKVVARWPLAPCQGPKGLAIDPKTRRLFASCANGLAVVVDADSGKIVTALPIGRGTDAADFDPETKRFLAPAGDGTLTVVAETGPDAFSVVGTVKTEPGARTMAIDPGTGRIFLVTATVLSTTPETGPTGHPHYVFAPGSLKLLIYAPGA